MSDFQRKCSMVAIALLVIGIVTSLVSLIIPEWILNFDVTGAPGQRYVKYGVFQKCTSTENGPFECGTFWTSDLQPGEGDWMLACRFMFALGLVLAIAAIVLAILFIVLKFVLFAIFVLGCAIGAGVCSIIGIALWMENWSKLILRYVDKNAKYGAGIWVMAVAIIFFVLASTLEGAALLMKVRKGHNNRGSSRPVFERRQPAHSGTKGMMSSSKI